MAEYRVIGVGQDPTAQDVSGLRVYAVFGSGGPNTKVTHFRTYVTFGGGGVATRVMFHRTYATTLRYPGRLVQTRIRS